MPRIDHPGTYEVKHVRINATSDGDNTVISAVPGRKIRVLSYVITATGAGTCLFQSTSDVVAASFSLAAQGGVSYAGGINAPAFETATGTGLEVSCAASQDILGHLTYQEVR